MATVLVVDDHPTFRAAARTLLQAEGYTVVGEAEDGAAAIAAAESLRPDIMLLDVQLPDMNGFDVASTISKAQPLLQIVLTSSRDAKDFGPLVEESGARGFIAKDALSGASIAELLD